MGFKYPAMFVIGLIGVSIFGVVWWIGRLAGWW